MNERTWDGYDGDDGSIHVIGNGHICAYGQGPNIVQLFGPPYSVASTFALRLPEDTPLSSRSWREPGAGIWHHELAERGSPVASAADAAVPDEACFLRSMRASEPVSMELVGHDAGSWVDAAGRGPLREATSAWLFMVPPGPPIYMNYPNPYRVYCFVWTTGSAVLVRSPGDGAMLLRLRPGEGSVFFASGRTYPACVETAERMVRLSPEEALAAARTGWGRELSRLVNTRYALPPDTPDRDRLAAAVEDVAVLIKGQQSAEGGVLAGHAYHLCYVRDQYGVSRGLLALGLVSEAKGILSFYWNVWRQFGMIRNAQAAGVPGVFHVHENDDVEMTAYLIIQAFDYLRASGDHAFLREILPMLTWAWQAQTRHFVGGMLPFNGDETYVAGGVLPRDTLVDGSAEATLLFIRAGELLLPYVRAGGLWREREMEEAQKLLEAIRSRYRDTFFVDGALITNNPARRSMPGGAPRFRHGVCERCKVRDGLVWTERTESGRYLCPRCFHEDALPSADEKTHVLASVSLVPLYIGATLLSTEELGSIADGLAEGFERTGTLPSSPDGATTVGYDYGFLLYTLAELGHPARHALYREMMDRRDPTGAWVEYYRNGVPSSTRCRAWESAINIEAALRYAALIPRRSPTAS